MNVKIDLATGTDTIYDTLTSRLASRSRLRAQSGTFVSSVLPTPVGPQNIMDAMGRLLSRSPLRDRRMARDTASTASPCPTTRACGAHHMCRFLQGSD